MMQPLSALAMSFGERSVYSLQMFLIGMGTVFGVLILLWGALELFHRMVEKSSEAFDEVPTVQAAPVPAAPVAAPAPTPAGDDALIAVITAAVAAAMAEENGGVVPTFRVVAFRKI